jgi:SAM-dependent methyltransferase
MPELGPEAAGPNAEQRASWNGVTGARWASTWQLHDRTEAQISEALLELAAPAPGERALDVGCGAGSTALRVAERVSAGGAPGRVTGIDFSAPLIAVARTRAAGTCASFVEADASTHPFQPEFDLVVSRFGVMFFSDPEPAFANLRRAAAPGGRLAFVCWRAFEDNPWATVPMDAARAVLPAIAPPPPDQPGPFGLAGRDRARGLLARAGWREIAIERRDHALFFGDTVEQAVHTAASILLLPRFLVDLGPELRAQVQDRLAGALAPFLGPGGIALGGSSWLVSARA